MATSVITNDVILLRHCCLAADQVGLNDVYYRAANLLGSPTYEDFLAFIDPLLSVTYRPAIPATAKRYGTQIRFVSRPTIAPISTGAGVLPGTAAGDLLPTQVSGIITKRTSLIGRANRGRMYIPFPADSFMDADETPTAAYVTLLTGIGVLLLTTIAFNDGAGNSCDFFPMIWHGTIPSSPDLVGGLARKRWGTQRRRGNYGRPNPPPW